MKCGIPRESEITAFGIRSGDEPEIRNPEADIGERIDLAA